MLRVIPLTIVTIDITCCEGNRNLDNSMNKQLPEETIQNSSVLQLDFVHVKGGEEAGNTGICDNS